MQKVLITAGATGIGYALAKQFSDAGYQIWIIDVSKKALKECPKDWERSNIDVCDENAMSSLFKKINDKWAGLDVLCANAGIAGSTALIEDQDAEAFRKCLDVNLTGAFLSVKGSLPIMKKQKKSFKELIDLAKSISDELKPGNNNYMDTSEQDNIPYLIERAERMYSSK